METKYFKKIYSNYIGFGKWKTGDGINYNEPEDKSYTVEFITKEEFETGVASMPPIPLTKEQVINNEIKETAIESLKVKGILDTNGDLKE